MNKRSYRVVSTFWTKSQLLNTYSIRLATIHGKLQDLSSFTEEFYIDKSLSDNIQKFCREGTEKIYTIQDEILNVRMEYE
jgi:hypothetical protein